MSELERWRVNLLIRTLATRHKTCAGVGLLRLGLYPGQETVLLILDRFGPMTQRQLVDRLGVEPPTVSAIAKKLEAGGFIARNRSCEDARTTIVDLTLKGRALLPAIRDVGRNLAETTLDGMDDETVEELMRSMKRAVDNLSAGCRSRPTER